MYWDFFGLARIGKMIGKVTLSLCLVRGKVIGKVYFLVEENGEEREYLSIDMFVMDFLL